MKTLLLTLILFFNSFADANGDVLVIGNKDTTPENITLYELKQIYKGYKTKWTNTLTPVKVFVLPSNNKASLLFFRKYFGFCPSTYWESLKDNDLDDNIFLPTVVLNEEKLYNEVHKTPGAIGYITSDMLNELNKPNSPHDIEITY